MAAGGKVQAVLDVIINGNKAMTGANQVAGAIGNISKKFNDVTNSINRAGDRMKGAFNLNTSNASKGADLLKQRISLAEKEAQMLRNRLASLSSVQMDPGKISLWEKKLTGATMRVERLRQTIAKAEATPVASDASIKQIETRLQKLIQVRDQLMKKMETATGKQFTQAEKALANVEGRITQVSNKLQRMKAPAMTPEIIKAREELVRAEAQAEKLRQELAQMKLGKDTSEEALRLEKRLVSVEQQAERAKSALASMQSGGGGLGGKLTSVVAGGSRMFSSFATGLDNIRQQFMNLNDTLRLTAQGMTNLGRSMLFFITIPVAGALTVMTRSAIDYQDALVRVAKTAGLVEVQTQQLDGYLRRIAETTSTSHTELANIASVIGQMGVSSPAAIANLTQAMNIFAVATDQTGDAVATTMGRIMNAFGKPLAGSTDQVWRLMNAINLLENKTAALAGEIQTTVADFAPFANALHISMAEAAGLAATLVSAGLSADEAGTALRNMSEYMVANADKVSQALGTVNAQYDTQEKLLAALETNSVQVFIDLANAVNGAASSTAAMSTLMEILEKRGGRAALLLAQNVAALQQNLKYATGQWSNATSLIEEYSRAMDSTKNQVGLLRNNIANLGMTIGDALLPVINEFAQVAVPAVRMVTNWFKNLSQSQKFNIMMWAGIILIAGPVLMLFGQIVHSISLIVMGFGQASRVIIFLIGTIGKLGPALLGVGRIFLGWPGLILAGIAGVLALLSAMGVDIGALFMRMASAAKVWGANLVKNLANGILGDGVRWLMDAITYVANLISSFFRSFSPPKAGPLKTIDQWGGNLMKTFFEGFKSADFGILEDIAGTIENILTAGLEKMALVGALRQLAKSRVKLTKLISEFNQTGVINEALLDEATAGMGDLTGNMKELVRATLRYKAVQEELAQLEERRKSITRTYDAEIAAIGGSEMALTDKVEAIRAAQRARDRGMKGLDKEEELLQRQAEMMKSQMEYQQGLIDSLQKQEDIFLRIADILKQIEEEKNNEEESGSDTGGSDGDMGGFDTGGLGGGGFSDDLTDLEEKGKKIEEQFRLMFEPISEGAAKFQGFLDAWNGIDPKTGLPEEVQSTYDQLYRLGTKAREVKDWFGEMKAALTGAGQTAPSSQVDTGSAPDASPWLQAAAGVGTFLGVLGGVGSIVSVVSGFLGKGGGLDGVLLQLMYKFNGVKGAIGPVISALLGLNPVVFGIIALVALLAAAWAGNWGGFRDVVNKALSGVMSILAPIIANIKTQFGALQPVIGQLKVAWGNLMTALQPLMPVFQWIGQALLVVAGVIVGVVLSAIVGLIDGVARLAVMVIAGFTQLVTGATNIFSGLVTVLTGIWNIIVGIFTGNQDRIKQGYETWGKGVGQVVEGAMQFIEGIFTTILGGISALVGGFVEGTIGTFASMYEAVTGKTTEWSTNFVAGIQETLNEITTFFTETVPQWVEAGKEMAQGFIDGAVQDFQDAVDKIVEIGQTIIDDFKRVLGIASPSTIFKDIGVNLIQGLIDGISSMVEMVGQIVGTVVDTVLDGINKLFGGGEQQGDGFDLNSMLPDEQEVQKRTKAIEQVVDAFTKSAVAAMEAAGKGMLEAWESAWDAIGQAAESANGLLDPFEKDVDTTFSAVAKAMQTDWTAAWNSIKSSTATGVSGVKTSILGLGTTIQNFATNSAAKINTSLTSAFDGVKRAVSSAKGAVEGLATSVGRLETRKVSEMATAWSTAASNISSAARSLGTIVGHLSSLENTTISVDVMARGSGANLSAAGDFNADDSTFKTTSGSVTPRASGGGVVAGNPYVVGELGPEPFIPNQNGRIVPNHLFEQMMANAAGGGGGGVQIGKIEVNLHNPVIRDGADIKRLAEEVSRELAKRLNQKISYGGNVAL